MPNRTRIVKPPVAPSRATYWPVILGIAAAVALLHMVTNSRYGFHRDELQFLWDARHLDWGFVAYPPFTPLVERLGLSVFGLSLVGLRLFSVLAQSAVIVLSGLMVRDLGGGRLAQAAACFSVALSPLPLFQGTEFQYSSFDFLWWVLACWFVVRLLQSEDPRWWLGIGMALGFGLQTKYSIVFLIAGIVGGALLSRTRRTLLSGWFFSGVALALVLFLPNLIWQAQHNFISYDFLQHIHKRDVGEGRAEGFLRDQFLLCANLFAAPLWLCGLIAALRSSRWRMIGWMYLIPLALFAAAKGRFYYLSPIYPILLAVGAAAASQWLRQRPRWVMRTVAAVYFTGVAVVGAYVCAIMLPLAPSGAVRDFALEHNGDLREEIGWDELVGTIARIRDSLPTDQQAHLGITVANYGEAGAIDVLGRAYNLPEPISTVNSGWLRGYPTPQPTTLIVVGLGSDEANSLFTGCRLAGHNGNALHVHNEESADHPDIFVCGPPREPWAVLWRKHHDFG